MSKNASVMLLAVGLLAAPALAACERAGAEAVGEEPPAQVEEIPGSDVKKVILSEDAEGAIGVETAPVSQGEGGQLTMPYAAVIYYLDGTTWAYTEPGDREFVRVPIKVSSIAGDVAILTEGPPVGTPVVVVGAPEVLGAELEIDGEQ